MSLMRTPRVLLVIALLLGQLAAVAHLTHDAAAEAANDAATPCEYCLHAAGVLGGAPPAQAAHGAHTASPPALAQPAAAAEPATPVRDYLIRGPPQPFVRQRIVA